MAADSVAQDGCRGTDDAGGPQCALPGCRHSVDEPGRPCRCCLAAFGTMLQEIPPAADIDSPQLTALRHPRLRRPCRCGVIFPHSR